MTALPALTPGEASKWELRKNYLRKDVLRADRLQQVSIGSELVRLSYLNEEQQPRVHELPIADWMRLQLDAAASDELDEVLGNVPVTTAEIVTARVLQINKVAEQAEPVIVEHGFLFAVHERVISRKTGKHGLVYRRDHFDCRATYGIRWDGSMVGQANCPEAELFTEPTTEQLHEAKKYESPEQALADGVENPDCFYYVRFSQGGLTTDPQRTAIAALLLNGLGDLLFVPSRLANEANEYETRDLSLSYSVALAHFFGRLLGALVFYDAQDELYQGTAYQVRKRYLDTILSGPDQLQLTDMEAVIAEYVPHAGSLTHARCELLFRLLRQCQRYLNLETIRHRAQPRNVLREGFSCDPATPTGYALRVSAYKAKPLFTARETFLLKELLQIFSGY